MDIGLPDVFAAAAVVHRALWSLGHATPLRLILSQIHGHFMDTRKTLKNETFHFNDLKSSLQTLLENYLHFEILTKSQNVDIWKTGSSSCVCRVLGNQIRSWLVVTLGPGPC